MMGLHIRTPRRGLRRGNISLLIPLIIAIVAGTMMMSDGFKGHRILVTAEQNKLDATRMARAFYQGVVRPSIEGRQMIGSAPAADQCPELSAFKNLSAAAADLKKDWTAATLPPTWCGVTLSNVIDVNRIEHLKLDVRRETADADALSSVIHVNLLLATKTTRGRPGGQVEFNRRLIMRAPRLADFAVIMKGMPAASLVSKDRFRLNNAVTRVEVRGPLYFEAGNVTAEELTDEVTKATPRLFIHKAFMRGGTSTDSGVGTPVDLKGFFTVFPSGITQNYLMTANMPYWEESHGTDPGVFRSAFGVQFDHSVRDATTPRLPLVAYEAFTSRLGPPPGGTAFSPIHSAAAYTLPVIAPPSTFDLHLNETCQPHPGASASTVAPLVLNSREGATVTIDFTKGNEDRFCGFINTDILRIKVRGDGAVNTIVGTFMARKILVEGSGGLIIAHSRSVASDPAGGPWPGQTESPWPIAAGETTSHMNRFSGTTANGYFKPFFVFDDYYAFDPSAVRAAYKPMRPHEVDGTGSAIGYYAPVPAGSSLLFPVASPPAVHFSDMNASEWLGVVFHLEQIL